MNGEPMYVAKYRQETGKQTQVPMGPTQKCRKCKQTKTIKGGRRFTAMGGPVTRYNPMIFECAECCTGQPQPEGALQ